MATWQEVHNYITANYKVVSNSDTMLGLIFETDDSRSQLIFVSSIHLDTGDLLVFRSSVAKVTAVDPRSVLVAAQNIPFGVTMGAEMYQLTHAQLLSTVDAAEIDYPLGAVTYWADFVEKRLGIGDEF